MSSDSVRFVHTSDLHLERTLGGLASVPTSLRDDFIDAPFRSATNVFDIAIKEDVDFVILAGDILDMETAGPRAIDFLLRQFERLQEKAIHIYWAGSSADDPDLWPAEIDLPKNVHLFPTGQSKTFEHRRRKRIIATLSGQSCVSADQNVSEYSNGHSSGAKIGVVHGDFDRYALQKHAVDYWALGGRHNEVTLYHEQSAARYCGSAQGFTPDEEGRHGCSLVTIEHGRVSCRLIPTDAIRWHREPLQLPADANRADLEQAIRVQLESLRRSQKGVRTLVTWSVSCNGALSHELQSDTTCANILAAISKNDTSQNDEIVSVAIEIEPRDVPAELFEEETIMGDFLRTVREYEDDPDRLIDLAEYLPEATVRHEVVSALTLSSPDERKAILRRVAALGIDFLSGEARHLETKS